jgi:hypothetical protein
MALHLWGNAPFALVCVGGHPTCTCRGPRVTSLTLGSRFIFLARGMMLTAMVGHAPQSVRADGRDGLQRRSSRLSTTFRSKKWVSVRATPGVRAGADRISASEMPRGSPRVAVQSLVSPASVVRPKRARSPRDKNGDAA